MEICQHDGRLLQEFWDGPLPLARGRTTNFYVTNGDSSFIRNFADCLPNYTRHIRLNLHTQHCETINSQLLFLFSVAQQPSSGLDSPNVEVSVSHTINL
jgi:hypothetical protein